MVGGTTLPRIGIWDRIKPLDERDFIAPLVVLEVVDEPAGKHDAKASLAQAKFVPQLDVADRILIRSGMGQIPGIEPGALVLNDQRDRFGSMR